MFEKNIFCPPPRHPSPQSPFLGAWLRQQNKNSVWNVLYLSFVRTHTKFDTKIFEIDIKWYLTFWPLPRAPGGLKHFAVADPIHVSYSHNKFAWISSNDLGGDSITDRRTDRWIDRWTEAITIRISSDKASNLPKPHPGSGSDRTIVSVRQVTALVMLYIGRLVTCGIDYPFTP